jgi:hypothetical protein
VIYVDIKKILLLDHESASACQITGDRKRPGQKKKGTPV